MIEASQEATATATDILRMHEECRTKITESLGRAAANGYRTMDRLIDPPIVNVPMVCEWLGITRAGGNNLVRRLVDIALLVEITGYSRNRRIRFDPYLQWFEQGADGEACGDDSSLGACVRGLSEVNGAGFSGGPNRGSGRRI